MNNQETNNRRMVPENGITRTESRESQIQAIWRYVAEAGNHQTKVVFNAFSPIAAPRVLERRRHININPGESSKTAVAGGV